jgi:hypothetical protein
MHLALFAANYRPHMRYPYEGDLKGIMMPRRKDGGGDACVGNSSVARSSLGSWYGVKGRPDSKSGCINPQKESEN